MEPLPFFNLFFAIAMLLPGHEKATKITVIIEGKPMAVYTAQANGSWQCFNPQGTKPMVTGELTFNKEKQQIIDRAVNTPPDAGPQEALNIGDYLKTDLKNPDAMSVTIDGQKIKVTNKGNDAILTQDGGEARGATVTTIHYEP